MILTAFGENNERYIKRLETLDLKLQTKTTLTGPSDVLFFKRHAIGYRYPLFRVKQYTTPYCNVTKGIATSATTKYKCPSNLHIRPTEDPKKAPLAV